MVTTTTSLVTIGFISLRQKSDPYTYLQPDGSYFNQQLDTRWEGLGTRL